MSEAGKTVAFVITASLLAIAAWFAWEMTNPVPVVGFEKVGEEFFPNFQDATDAKELDVTAFNTDTDGIREFSVKFADGLWRIPSHHGYPAEASDRLARTATSLIGLQRESIVARRNSKHEEFGVVDPADPEADVDSAGQRITLRNESGDVLADYIIGKPAGKAVADSPSMVRELDEQSDYFYVRVPDEKETYKARVQIDLSTRFSDWINPDLLKLEAADINRLEIDNYELAEASVASGTSQVQTQISKKVIDRQKLTRDGMGPWQLDGLNDETEELESLKVEELLTLLDSMKIVGVRPKLKLNGQPLVKSDLSINEELARQNPQLFQRAVYQLQEDLEMKGFTIGATEDDPNSIALLGSQGELRAATNNGVLYTLYFGRSVTGGDKEIEIGAANPQQPDGAATETDDNGDSNPQDPNAVASEPTNAAAPAEAVADESSGEDTSGDNKSRYVAIRVDFDIAALGPAPVAPAEPVEPKKPEGYDAWKEAREKEAQPDEEKDGNSVDAGGASGEAAAEQDQSPEPPGDIKQANDEEFLKYEAAQAEYQQARIQYTTDLEMYESEKIAYDTREKDGKQQVAQLNERFAEWFYVIPAESLESLKLTRGDLVKIKETPPPNINAPVSPGEFGNPNDALPAAPNIEFPKSRAEPAADPQPTVDEPGKAGKDEGQSADGSESPDSATKSKSPPTKDEKQQEDPDG